MKNINKIIVLGSGALKIGEAGEFDYSGSQAIKALKEEGIKTVLVNPNIATIQTSKFLADKIYFLPVNEFFVEKVIRKERPDGILLSFGGQTALNCGMLLEASGVLKKYNVKVLGTPLSAIKLSEDREKFSKHLEKIGVSTPKSQAVTNIKSALSVAQEIGYPVMIRAGFALGGQGSGIVHSSSELTELATKAFAFVKQILVEQYLHHYKEVEYEIVRDQSDNCVAVCNMENLDPLGIHTGDSIVVAPSQTLTNYEYHNLRTLSIKIARSLGIVGECNVQFALNPNPKKGGLEYYVIELNARLSRSSALASKATGYPLAYIAAKLALGKKMTEITNKVTRVTKACFEPALDYIVVKIPRWDIEKFQGADERIGTSMKSVGEVMAIGRTFEEAYQKAIRMLGLDIQGAASELMLKKGDTPEKYLRVPTPKRIFAIAHALRKNKTIKSIHNITGIDNWFLYRIKNIVDAEKEIQKNKKLTKKNLLKFKKLGFSDKRLGYLLDRTGLQIRELRMRHGIKPSVFQIDTLAGEFPAKTNYLYLTYNGNHYDVAPTGKKGVIVLGSGPYRIGSSVEFDWTSVSTVLALKKYKKKSIIINCNPETVSTDYDISDRLYFEELTFERIADIADFENAQGLIVSVGGQTPNNKAKALKSYGFKIIGTDPDDIDRAEDRSKFSSLLDDLGIIQPAWAKFTDEKSALQFCKKVGYPVLIRPSYVLSGTMMRTCDTKEELRKFLKEAALVSRKYPVTVSKFVEGAKEIELDAVAQRGNVKISIISEHIENAGVHSGDATIILPPQRIYLETQRKVEDIARKIAKALNITGPFNMQFLAKDNGLQVIEVNLRSSRTFPFISKVTGINFIDVAVDAFFKKNVRQIEIPKINFVGVKSAQFSFARLTGADPILSVEMGSTGEVACFGDSVEEALLKSEFSVGTRIPIKGIFLSLGGNENKVRFLENAKQLPSWNLPIYATDKTARFLNSNGVKARRLYKIYEGKSPNFLDMIKKSRIDLAINILEPGLQKDSEDNYKVRRAAIDSNITLITNRQKAKLFVGAVTKNNINNIPIKSWDEYTI